MECKICLNNKSRWDTPKGSTNPICLSCMRELGYEQNEDGEWVMGEQAESPAPVPAEAAEVALIEGPRLPMADEGQRGYTEAEVQEIIAQAERRVFRALSKALGGPGWKWLPETRRKLTRQVRNVMSKMGKRPEVSNANNRN